MCSMFIETETTRVRRLKLGMKVGVGQGRVIGYKVGGSEAGGGRGGRFSGILADLRRKEAEFDLGS